MTIRLLNSTILRGCNLYHGATVIRQKVHMGALARVRSGRAGPEFAEGFLARFSALRERMPESAMSAAFIERLRSAEGVPFEEVLLEAILAVDTALAFVMRDLAPFEFAQVVPIADSRRRVYLVWECRVPRFSRAAAEVALLGLQELLPQEERASGSELAIGVEGERPGDARRDFAAAFAALEAKAHKAARSTTTAVLALAAKRRGIPCEPLGGPYLRLGQGAAQRLVYSSVTERTSLGASQLARDKHRTNRRLAELRLPVTRQIAVRNAAEALAAAEAIGYPVVLKPLKQKQALGVSVGVTSAEQVPAAFRRARENDKRVIVESFAEGNVYRLLVIGNKFTAALQTMPATVTGDGERTIGQLVAELNADPARDGVRLFKVEVNEELERDLGLSGHSLDHVLPPGKTLALRRAANVAIGGLHSDATDRVHPDNRELAVRAAQGIGLDIAGVDFVTPDISRSYKEVGGSIIEVNARPGLCMHTCPRHGQSRHAAGTLLDAMFPPDTTSRIPIAILAGDRRAVRAARELDGLLRASGKTVALATRRGAFVDGEPAGIAPSQQRKAVPILLSDPRLQSLVSAVAVRAPAKRGLGIDACEVAAIVNARADRKSRRALAQTAAVLARAARKMVVVHAGNHVALRALAELDAERLVLVGSDPQDPVIAQHVAASGTVVLNVHERGQEWIVVYRDGRVIVSVRAAETGKGRRLRARRLQSQMFAVALAYGMGVAPADIERAAALGVEPTATRVPTEAPQASV